MAGSPDDIWQALQAADALPPGRARTERLEQLVEQADIDGDAERATAARLSLAPALLHGGRHREIGPVLAWLLARYEEQQSWLGPWERQSILFSFTWATSALLPHPDVPLAQIEAALADMTARYRAAGESLTPVLKVRYDLAVHRHGYAEAEEAYEAWVEASRSDLSDCASCEQADHIRHLTATGRHQAAAALAMPLLDEPPECRGQPYQTIAAAMESLLVVGETERAAFEHMRGVRLLRMHEDDEVGDPGDALHPDQVHGPVSAIPGRAEHLMVCARSGRLDRGLDLLQYWMPWLASGSAPAYQVMVTTAAGGRLLRGVTEAGGGDLQITTGRWGDVSAERLGSRLAGRARDLAARFDARNGTDAIGRLVASMLDAPDDLPDLPLDFVARAPQSMRLPRREPLTAPVRATGRRGRRVAQDEGPQALADAGDLAGLAQAFRDAATADSAERRAAVLSAWRSARDIYLDLPEDDFEGSRSAARLDAWLALADLERAADNPLVGAHEAEELRIAAAAAADRLRRAGLSAEALLHEQSCVMATARAGRIDAAEAMTRVGKTAAQVSAEGTPGQVGLAYCRLALAREAVARAGLSEPALDLGELGADLREHDPVDQSIAALTSVYPTELDSQQMRALCRMLRLRAVDEPPEQAVASLRAAIDALPDGVRPVERAMAHADLAAKLIDVDPHASLDAWNRAVRDALAADAAPVLGNLLAAAATVQHGMGDPEGAADRLAQAVPLLDRHSPGPLAAQARFDLARALLDCGRAIEAAELAEAALADLTAGVERLEQLAPLEYDDGDPELGELIHLTGAAAFVVAETLAVLGDVAGARAAAARSAAWHRRNGNLVAQSEAWQLAARVGGPPSQVVADLQRAIELAEEAGDWDGAATCRRERIAAIQEAMGPEAALEALIEADEVLQALRDASTGQLPIASGAHMAPARPVGLTLSGGHRLAWHRVALAEQRARLLALVGRYPEALKQVEGLDEGYRTLGDDRAARDLLGLRGQLRAELGDLDGALVDLRGAALEAEAAADATQAHGLGQRLAQVLDDAGRPDEAEDAWVRFCAAHEGVDLFGEDDEDQLQPDAASTGEGEGPGEAADAVRPEPPAGPDAPDAPEVAETAETAETAEAPEEPQGDLRTTDQAEASASDGGSPADPAADPLSDPLPDPLSDPLPEPLRST